MYAPPYAPDPRRRRLAAFAAVLLLPLASVAVLAVLVERPFAPVTRPAGPRRAAVAIRDDVVAFQKWGSRAFTMPYLERVYDRVWYITANGRDDGRVALVAALDEAARSAEVVDLFLLAHGNGYVRWVTPLDASVTSRLRLVYNTGCGDADQAPRWLALGADAYVGHVGESGSPVFFVYFLRRWAAGNSLGAAVDTANAATAEGLARLSWFGVSHDRTARWAEGSRAVRAGPPELRIGG